MTNNDSGDVYRRAGNWLIGTAKRHPEALLVLAAGCALLMRGGGGSSQGHNPYDTVWMWRELKVEDSR
jgi:hypothetical protein